MSVVTKDFKTVNRRFRAGDPIEASDVQGAVSFDVFKERGFIGDDKPSSAAAKLFSVPVKDIGEID